MTPALALVSVLAWLTLPVGQPVAPMNRLAQPPVANTNA
jgi:hypothetical protein